MKRKLIKQGGGGYTLYLPKKWVDAQGLGAGDEVDVSSLGSGLLIAAKTPAGRSLSLQLSSLTESSIRTQITNAYRAGYDCIDVSFSDVSQFKILQQVIVSRLIGFEITEKSSNSCLVENITEPSDDQYDVILRKVFFSIEEFFTLTREHFSAEKTGDFVEVAERVQRYDNYCRRIIGKRRLQLSAPEFTWAFLSILIHAQRELYHLNKLLPCDVSARTKNLFAAAHEVFVLLHQAFYKNDMSLVERSHEIFFQTYYSEGYAFIQSVSKKESLIVHHALVALRQFYLASSPLMGLLLEES